MPSRLPFLLIITGVCTTMAWAQAQWRAETTGAFRTAQSVAFSAQLRRPVPALELAYPAKTTSTPGQYGQWLTALPRGGAAVVEFTWSDDFAGPTTGYHFLQLLVDDQVVWEHDLGGEAQTSDAVRVPVQLAPNAPLIFRLLDKQMVTNFPVRVRVAAVRLHHGADALDLTPTRLPSAALEPWPPDLPSPALPPTGGWSWQANIVQPWGKTQTVAVRDATLWARRFAHDYGLNALIMLPPAAHNAITGPAHHITEDQFRAALADYRRQGLKIILYTSIMHLGHDPEWQSGELARTHPEWSMRGPTGETVNIYGSAWLCPSTAARDHAIEYTARLVRDYDADAVMLDNNEFMKTASGQPTCYCDACRQGFRRYVLARFGGRLEQLTGVTPDALAIPQHAEGPLWGLWLSWRNRLWGEACEAFRLRLRELKPSLVVLANTQYLYQTYTLAVDGQYAHLDAVLSESRGCDGVQMAAKMLLGRALAKGRPLWNYIGTFDEKDFTKLRPADEVAAVCAASEAFGANPWLVFYGFTGDENQAALAQIRQYADFWRDHAALLGAGELRGEVGVLVSTESRDLGQAPLPVTLLGELVQQGQLVKALRDAESLTAPDFEGLKILVTTHSPCLSEAAAAALGQWVHAGGTLITRSDCGWLDRYGRWRAQSALQQALGLDVSQPGERSCGQGLVITVSDSAAVAPLLAARLPRRLAGEATVGLCWNRATDGREVISLTGFTGPVGPVTLRLPGPARSAELHLPGQAPRLLTVTSDHTVTCTIPGRLGLIVIQKAS